MGSIRSWEIVYAPRQETRRPDAPQAPLLPLQTQSPDEAQGIRTTGLFDVPGDNGSAIDLSVFLSSFSDAAHEVRIEVSQQVDSTLRSIFTRTLQVPPGEARGVQVSDVAGMRLQVNVDAPAEIVPSAAVTQFFLADGGILVLVFKSPADFISV